MWKWIVVGILGVGIMTCPDREDHIKEIRKVLSTNMNASQEGAMTSLFMSALGGNGVIEDTMINALKIKCDNYLIFSVGTGIVNGKRVAISLGAFGQVAMNDEDE